MSKNTLQTVYMRVHFVIHEDFEGPGAIEHWVKMRRFHSSYSRVYLYESLPDVFDFDLLVVMGGPQSSSTTLAECPYFDAAAEMELIRRAVEHKKMVLGVCLGAQLIGEALGGTCIPSPNREVGVFPIQFTADGRNDTLFSHIPDGTVVGHWHNDMPGLTPGSHILAYSEGCPRQIIRYDNRVYGLQCHLEFTADSVEALIAHSGGNLEGSQEVPFVQSAEQLRRNDYREMNKLLFAFLDEFTNQATILPPPGYSEF